MTLKLVGAGLPRTGTMSLKAALERLLDAPCYHMVEVFAHPEHAGVWAAAMQGDPPDWEHFLRGYAAGVDMPLAARWEEIAAVYPDAPVLLSRRESAEVWWRSMDKTVLEQVRRLRDPDAMSDAPPGQREMFEAMHTGIFSDPDDKESIKAGYERHLDHVRATVAADRLVEWQPGDGWEPLCTALGLPVPDEEFPHENTAAEFRERVEQRAEE